MLQPHPRRQLVGFTLARILLGIFVLMVNPLKADSPQRHWVRFIPKNSPAARAGASVAFDSDRGQLLLFGGHQSQRADGRFFDDTWIWNGSEWNPIFPDIHPFERTGASLAFDAIHHQLILFGGLSPTLMEKQVLAETWLWDGSNWLQLFPDDSPPARYEASMAFDPSSGNLLLFGGRNVDGSLFFNDTWMWNGRNWLEVTPPHHPSSRSGASMALDPVSGHLLLFGGIGEPNKTIFDDTWIWDGIDWIKLKPAQRPSHRSNASLGFDPGSEQLLLFGGMNVNLGLEYDDTWLWNGSNWIRSFSAHHPSARAFAAMAYNPLLGQLVLWGGKVKRSVLDDTWASIIASTTVTVSIEPNPANEGETLTLKAIVYPPSATGKATFFDETKAIGTAVLIDGIATLESAHFGAGNHTLKAMYRGDNIHLSSTSVIETLTVKPRIVSTVTTLDATPYSLIENLMILRATIQPPLATGVVTFFDGKNEMGTLSLVDGKVTLAVSNFQKGLHALKAVYKGDYIHLASTSEIVNLNITLVFPPIHLHGHQESNQFVSQKDVINILTWDDPVEGNVPIAYRIYRDKHLRDLAAEIPYRKKLQFKDHNRKEKKTHTYYIVSVDKFGNVSEPASVRIKGH